MQPEAEQHGMLAATSEEAVATAAAIASSPTSAAEGGMQGSQGADVHIGGAVPARLVTPQQGGNAGPMY